MQEERIRLSKTDSSYSVNKENFVDVQLQHHTKVFPFPSISDTIDQREVFEKEREEATKYRIILSINPYCSNILFNAVTEIVQNEGTDDRNKLVIASSTGIQPKTSSYEIRGKNTNVTNTDMVRNTEYENCDEPFIYHCGYDIFNNHILRNQTFKLVNNKSSRSNNFNTIRDEMRNGNGEDIKLYRRTDISKIEPGNKTRHLYMREDVLNVTDSINANLTEENGWFGFNNRSSIASCEFKNNEWDDMKISKVFNNEHMACEFIEMYPDSSLYSFNPKYNSFQNREEHNWDICLTYPYENDEGDDKVLINTTLNNGDKLNSLLVASFEQTIGTSGQDIILFRSYVKHNLNVGDKIKLFYNDTNNLGEANFEELSDRTFEIVNVGNLKNEYQDYYFYINDVSEVLNILKEETLSQEHTFRFVKVVNDVNCKYYYRKFKKLPNFRIKREELTKEVAEDRDSFENYVNNNCKKNGKMIDFNKEQYQLAFSRTIYNDTNAQITFTDSIDIDNIVDNLGRPLTEIYVTFIKRNKGHDLWYKKSKTPEQVKNIEYSHCFSEVISGLEMHTEWSDNADLLQRRKQLSDITSNCLETRDYALDTDITIDTEEFYGDLVELDQYNMKETVLSDICFRFNTEQREHTFASDELNCGKFIYDEIMTDDYDSANFNCQEFDADKIGSNYGQEEYEQLQKTTYRREGYYYKAHFPVKVRDFGVIRQGSHREIKIASCKPKQAGGMFIEVVSKLRTGANGGAIVYLCDENNEKIPLTVNTVQSSVRFLLNPMEIGSDNYKSVFEIVNGLLYSTRTIENEDDYWTDENGNEHLANKEDVGASINDYSKPKYKLRIKNYDIPNYAREVGTNVYLWRDILNIGNKDAVNVEEYPFANGHFYINKNINFFLKRQDPFGYNGLMDKDIWPNDIYGNSKNPSNYEYKDETNVVC